MQNHGITSRSDLLRTGVSSNEIQRRVRSGEWQRIRTGIYALERVDPADPNAASVAWRRRFAAEVCWGGDEAAISHRAAAFLYGFDGFLTPPVARPEVTVPGRSACRGTHVHRSNHVLPRLVVSDLPVVTPEVCLLQLGQVCSPFGVEAALESALRHGITTLARVIEVAHGTLGRIEGGRILRAILRQRPIDAVPTANSLETSVLQVMRGLGCREIERHVTLGVEDYSFVVRRRHLCVVCSPTDVVAGATIRDFGETGWTVVEFGLRDLAAGPRAMAETVRTAILRSQRLSARVRRQNAGPTAGDVARRAA